MSDTPLVHYTSRSQPTVSSCSPNTEALDKIVLSMKLNMYVTNSSGIRCRSILRKTLFPIAICSSSAAADALGPGSCISTMYIVSNLLVKNPGALKC